MENWQGCEHPRGSIMIGQRCRLEPIDVERHCEDLFNAFIQDQLHANWTYLPYGPFSDLVVFQDWVEATCLGDDPCFFSIIDLETETAVGVASYLRIQPEIGVIETGHIHLSPLMQGKPIATEAMFLMMKRVLGELGYRRYEWKCDALNQPSCNAAKRLGFMYEGLFRQALMYKKRNRDTAWFSILDREWPTAQAVFERWLDPANFDAAGQQRSQLSVEMQSALNPLR